MAAVGAIGSALSNEVLAGTTLAAGAVVLNLHQARQAGGEIVSNLVQGVRGGVAPVAAAGRELTEVLVSGVTSAFGESGQAVSRVVSRGLDAVGRTASNVFDGVSNSLGKVGELAGTAIGAVTTGIGALGGAILGPVGALVGGVVGSAVGAISTKVLAGVTGLFGGVLEIAGESIGALGSVFAEGFRGILDIGRDTFQNLLRYAREVQSVSQRSGMSLRSAQRATGILGAFGVDASGVEGITRNVGISRMTGAVFGVGGEPGSEQWLRSLRSRYQGQASQGWFGHMMAENMLSTVAGNQGAEQLRGVVNMPQGIFNRQIETQRRLGASLGISPEPIAEADNNMRTLVASVSSGIARIKNLIAVNAMPYIIKAVEGGIGWLEQNADRVRTGIQRGVKWLFEELPPMLLRAGATGMRGVSLVLAGLASMTGAMAAVAEGINTNLPSILTTLDNVLNGIRDFVVGAMEVIGFLRGVGGNIANPEARREAITGGITGAVGYGAAGALIGGVAGGALGALPGIILKNPILTQTGVKIGAGIGARAGGAVGAAYGLYRGAVPPLTEGPSSERDRPAGVGAGIVPGDDELGSSWEIVKKFWRLAHGDTSPEPPTLDDSVRKWGRTLPTGSTGVRPGNVWDAGRSLRERFLAAVPESHLAERYGRDSALSRMIGGAGSNLRNAQGFLEGKSREASELADALNRYADAYERMIVEMQEQSRLQRKIADNTGDTARGLNPAMRRAAMDAMTNKLQKEHLSILRSR
jgi:hypothetical protein